jgi:hypothetical protein
MKYLILPSRTARPVGDRKKPDRLDYRQYDGAGVKNFNTDMWRSDMLEYDEYIKRLPVYNLHPSFPDLPEGTVVEGVVKPCRCKLSDSCPYGDSGSYESRYCYVLYPISAEQEKPSPMPGSEQRDYPGWKFGLSEFEWQMEQVIDAVRSAPTTLEAMAPLRKLVKMYGTPSDELPERPSEQASKPDTQKWTAIFTNEQKFIDFCRWQKLQHEPLPSEQPGKGEGSYSMQQAWLMWQDELPITDPQNVREQARLFAESHMQLNWNRHDEVLICAFYENYSKYIFNQLAKAASLPAHPQEGFTKEQVINFLNELPSIVKSGEKWLHKKDEWCAEELVEMFLQQPLNK